MSDKDTGRDDAALDAAFAGLRAAERVPSQAFLARVLADAAAAMPARPDIARAQGGGWLAALLDGIGGWRAGAALTAAAVLGLAIGLSGLADDLSGSAAGLLGDTALYDGYSGLLDDAAIEG